MFQHCLKLFALVTLIFGCQQSTDESSVKEFEFSLNICQDITNAVDTRWNESTGKTKAQYHADLVASERQIITYELTRYRQRLQEMQSQSGPANGPGGNDVPLANGADKEDEESPDDSPFAPATNNQNNQNVDPFTGNPTSTNDPFGGNTNTDPFAGNTTDTNNTNSGNGGFDNGTNNNGTNNNGGFDNSASTNGGFDNGTNNNGGFDNGTDGFGLFFGSTTTAPQTNVSLAQEVCAGCSIDEVRTKLSTLESNNTKINGCQAPQEQQVTNEAGETLSAADEAKRKKDIEEIKNIVMAAQAPKVLCEWWGSHAGGVGASRDRCRRETISGFCQAAANAVVNSSTSAASGDNGGEIAADVVKTIPAAVKTAIVGCVQQMAYDTVKSALRDAGTRQFVPQLTQDLAQNAIQSDALSDEAKKNKRRQLAKAIALQMCKAATGLIANQIDEQPQINYDNPCRAIFQGSKSRAKACLNTTNSLCSIAAGDVDVKKFFPEDAKIDEKPLESLTAEAANTIAGMGCDAGGISWACAAITESAAQIRKAITTGNNDWAHCVGTDQMGACGGTVYAEWMLGIKNGDSAQPIRPTVPSSTPGYREKDICWCYYSCYQDDWGSNTELHRSNYYTVISAGGAGQRECRNQDGRWNWTGKKSRAGYHIYWKKRSCEIVRARSNAEGGFNSTGSFEVRYNGRWIRKNMTATSGSCPSGI